MGGAALVVFAAALLAQGPAKTPPPAEKPAATTSSEKAAVKPASKTASEKPAEKDALLPAPVVMGQGNQQLTALSVTNLQTGNQVTVSLKDAVASLPSVGEWTLYVVDAQADEIKWSKGGKGKPPDEIPWDGLFDDGSYPESGKVYAFKAVLQVAGAFRKTKAVDLKAIFVSSDVIEIAQISQRAGIGICSLKPADGEGLAGLPCFGGASRVLLGSFVVLDISVVKELSTEKDPEVGGMPVDGSFTFLSAASSLRYRLDAFDLQLGAAFLYSRVGYSATEWDEAATGASLQDPEAPPADGAEELEEPTEPREPARISAGVQSAAARLAARYNGRRALASVEIAHGFSKTASSLAAGISGDYVLSPSWFVGAEAWLVRLGASRGGDPSLTFTSFLVHVGFDIRRGAP